MERRERRIRRKRRKQSERRVRAQVVCECVCVCVCVLCVFCVSPRVFYSKWKGTENYERVYTGYKQTYLLMRA